MPDPSSCVTYILLTEDDPATPDQGASILPRRAGQYFSDLGINNSSSPETQAYSKYYNTSAFQVATLLKKQPS